MESDTLSGNYCKQVVVENPLNEHGLRVLTYDHYHSD